MNLAVDLILIVILFFGILLGIKRGFVKTVAKPVKLVAVWVCSFKTCASFSSRMIEPSIGASVTGRLSAILRERCASLTPQNASEDLPLVLKIAAGIFDIDVNEVVADSGSALADRLAETFASPLVSIVSAVISFILLLIIFSVLFSLVIYVVNLIFRLRPLKWMNRLLGFIFGFAFSFIVAWLISMLIGFVFGLDALQSVGFEGGAVYRFFREYHPLDLLLRL